MKIDCLHFASEHMAVMSTLQRTTLRDNTDSGVVSVCVASILK